MGLDESSVRVSTAIKLPLEYLYFSLKLYLSLHA